MSILKDYSRKDIVDIRKYLINQINDICDKYDVEGWTDRNESDLGMVFVELAAGIADMMNFNLDKQALETYLPTVVQRKNAKKILSLINYEMKPPVSAVCTLQFTLDQALDFDLTIPKYFQVSYRRDEGNIYYATAEDCQLLKGTTSVNVKGIQGIVNNSTLTVYDVYRSRKVEIDNDKVAYNSVRLIINGKEWTQVPDVLLDIDKGTKFSVHETSDDNAFIEFDYSWRDYLPSDQDAEVLIQFLETEGSLGSVVKGTLDTLEELVINNGYDYTDRVSVINITDASGGADRETIESAKANAPRILSSANLMTTLRDYENIALTYPGVYETVAVDWTTDGGRFISVPYEVNLYVMTTDSNTNVASKDFLDGLYEYLLKYKWSSIKLRCITADLYKINVHVVIHTASDKSYYPEIRRNAEDAIRDFFKKSNQSFGAKITIGKVEDIIKYSDDRIDYCEVNNPESIIKLDLNQFPVLNDLEITVEEV